jgi:hypothetical protein
MQNYLKLKGINFVPDFVKFGNIQKLHGRKQSTKWIGYGVAPPENYYVYLPGVPSTIHTGIHIICIGF